MQKIARIATRGAQAVAGRRRSTRCVSSTRRAFSSTQPAPAKSALELSDPEVFQICQNEKERQRIGVQLIASENYTSAAVREAVSSYLMHKYSEGYPNARYYSGNKYIDENELLCQKRALEAFRLDPAKWGVNVQPLSGSPANFAVYTALLQSHDRIMGLDLPHGGHLTHGYMTGKKRISATSIFFESMPYRLNEATGEVDYAEAKKLAGFFRPKLVIAGASAYPKMWDYKKMREVADVNESILLADMAHTAGLVAAEVAADPFEYADVVTSTTHKTLRGPRGGIIFFRRGVKTVDKKTGKERPVPDLITDDDPPMSLLLHALARKNNNFVPRIMYDYEERINSAVFPALQGGPHNHTIAGISVALKEATSKEFKSYQDQVIRNAAALANKLKLLGYTLVGGGTENHLLLVDLRPQGIDGARVAEVMERVSLYCNKNAIPGDTRPFVPGGVRLGSPAMTSRGLKVAEFEVIAEFIDKAIKLTLKIDRQLQAENKKKLVDFVQALNASQYPEIDTLRAEVELWCQGYPMP